MKDRDNGAQITQHFHLSLKRQMGEIDQQFEQTIGTDNTAVLSNYTFQKENVHCHFFMWTKQKEAVSDVCQWLIYFGLS